ncbi:MAG: 7-carboxy-7-deazaguanine synthase QueE [bacterium]
MQDIKVTTIFCSIQGEATHIGKSTIFIRLYGCNLDCSFCDDLLHTKSYTPYSYDDIMDEISQYKTKHIIITGGEPSIYDLNEFIHFLQKHKYYVSIETNGFNFENIKQANWITYSPKDWSKIHLDYCDEYKFVVNHKSNIEPILELKTEKPIYIQAENFVETPNMVNIQYCMEIVKKYPKFKLSVQLHKFLQIK